jgi:hypothetical protein
MAEEIDRKIMPDFLQTVFAVSLGATYKSIEMMKDPVTSATTVWDELTGLFVMPKDAGDGLQKKAEAIAAVWMEKGATLFESWKSAGEKFTEEKK